MSPPGSGTAKGALPSAIGERVMSINPYLDGHQFDAETKRIMDIAFEMTRAALRVSNQDDLASEILAEEVIALAKAGERNPERICEMTLDHLRRCAGPPAPMTDC